MKRIIMPSPPAPLPLSTAGEGRQGVALITALIAMAVLTVILSVVTLQVVRQHNYVRQRQRQLQADWLTRAGVEVAAARLLQSPAGFSDDKQELAADTKVRIVVEKTDADSYLVTVEVQVGLEGPTVTRGASARFRRTDAGGMVRLQRIPAPT